VQVVNVDVPTCATGTVRGVVQVAAAALAGRNINQVDCSSRATGPKDDVDGFVEGFATVTVLDVHGRTVTATTVFGG
jgi:hypothetical protein